MLVPVHYSRLVSRDEFMRGAKAPNYSQKTHSIFNRGKLMYKFCVIKNISIYYVFKCGLHYLAMLKLFLRIIFACLTKEFFHVEDISYIAVFKVFSIFQFKFNVYLIKFENSNPILGFCQSFPRFCDYGLPL